MCQSTGAANDDAAGEACPADCRTCSPDPGDGPPAGAPTGWRLGVSAAGVFLLPLAAAVVGAAISSPERQLVGCLIGLAVGAAAAAATARLLRKPSEER